jgi:hypothetical protein
MLQRNRIIVASLIGTVTVLTVAPSKGTAPTAHPPHTTLPQLWVFPSGVHHAAKPLISPIYDVEYKNSHYVLPPVPTAGGGHVIEIPLQAPGTIDRVTMYHKEGPGCDWTYQCPDGTQCPDPYRNPVVMSGNTAKYHTWSNSGENCALFFQIEFH